MSGSSKTRENKREKDLVDEKRVLQGELYSPNHALRNPPVEKYSNHSRNQVKEGDVVSATGQGELYSPKHALKLTAQESQEDPSTSTMMMKGRGSLVGDNIKRRMGMLKEKVLEKLSAATAAASSTSSSSSDNSDLNNNNNNHQSQNHTALENAKSFIETVIRDVGMAAQGMTKDALQRIKSHLADIFPSLSPSLTSKMVDEAEKEVTCGENSGGEGLGARQEEEEDENERQVVNQQQQIIKGSPASSLFTSIVSTIPMSRL